MIDWDQVFDQNAGAVWRAAYRLLGSRADADECMQEAFVGAIRLSGRQQVRNWRAMLLCLATSRALDCLRRRLDRKAPDNVDWKVLPSADDPPDARPMRSELSDCLRRALNRLPRQQAEAFCLRHVEDMSYEDIADQIQVSANSVGAILHRARERLRELLCEFAVEREG